METKTKRRPPIEKQLVEYFIAPLLKVKPKNHDAREWLAAVFHRDTRHITTFRALSNFELPGSYKYTAARTVVGMGDRKVRAGFVLYVCTDAVAPDLVEAEIINPKNDDPRRTPKWFVMTRDEWRKVMPKVEKL